MNANYLPEMDNLIILKREYNNEYDIGSYKIIDLWKKSTVKKFIKSIHISCL